MNISRKVMLVFTCACLSQYAILNSAHAQFAVPSGFGGSGPTVSTEPLKPRQQSKSPEDEQRQRERGRQEQAAIDAADTADRKTAVTEDPQYLRDKAAFEATYRLPKSVGDNVCGKLAMMGIGEIGQVENVKGNMIQVRESITGTEGNAYSYGTPGHDHLEWMRMNSVGLCRARSRLFILHECEKSGNIFNIGLVKNTISALCPMLTDLQADH